jgi:hypothetical protein
MSARRLDVFEVAQVPLTLQRNADALSPCDGPATQSPDIPILSPLRREGTAIVRFLQLGRVAVNGHPTVFEQEILQARALFPPIS